MHLLLLTSCACILVLICLYIINFLCILVHRQGEPRGNCNIMTDCDQEQIVALLAVYSQSQVLLCTWHVLYVIQSHFQTDHFPDLWALIKKLIHTSDLAGFNRILDKISSDLAFSQSSFKHFSTQWLSLVHMWSGNS